MGLPNKIIKNILGDTVSKNSVSLYCPNCGENLGKDVENPKKAYCSVCGQSNIKNPRGE